MAKWVCLQAMCLLSPYCVPSPGMGTGTGGDKIKPGPCLLTGEAALEHVFSGRGVTVVLRAMRESRCRGDCAGLFWNSPGRLGRAPLSLAG